MNKFSLFSFPLLRIIYLFVVFITRIIIMSFIDEISQVLFGLNSNPFVVLVQSREKLLTSVITKRLLKIDKLHISYSC